MSIVTLLTELVEPLSKSEQNVITNPKDFYSLETSVKESTEAFAASFLSLVLNDINSKIESDVWSIPVNVNEKVYHSLAKKFTTLLAKNFTIFPFSLVNKFTSSAIEKVYHSRYRKSLPPSILLWGIPQ